MMIKIDEIQIEDFRGIRSISLNLMGQNFVVVGPNGSGKSGVIDAVDFALTGSVRRLSGAGTGGLTVRNHGPHVTQVDHPERARVSLRIHDVDTKEATILVRSVAAPGEFLLDPEIPSIRETISMLKEHPEITLSRREIVKFVTAQPTDRAKDVQNLLRLDRLRAYRENLSRANNQLKAAAKAATDRSASATGGLRRCLDLGMPKNADVLEAINRHRSILNLEPLAVLSPGIVLAPAEGGGSLANGALNKDSVNKDFGHLRSSAREQSEIQESKGTLLAGRKRFVDDPQLLTRLDQADLLEAGLSQVSDENCPLCDLSWSDQEALTTHIKTKIEQMSDAVALNVALLAAAREVGSRMRDIREAIGTARSVAHGLKLDGPVREFDAWGESLVRLETKFLDVRGIIACDAESLKDPCLWKDSIDKAIVDCELAVESLPEESPTETSRSLLLKAQGHLESLRLAEREAVAAEAAHKRSQVAYDLYCATQDGALTKLYESVETDFATYYRFLNSDDESTFTAKFTPKASQLDFKVDFYGLGDYPPGAFHSEGHQDSMGVCLYLALMRQVMGDDFKLAVLDDVVMSVDTDHRRRLVRLLRTEFEEVQFLLTTHDKVWARQMQSGGLVTPHGHARFWGWTVEGGPAHYQGETFWDDIAAHLERDKIPEAAACLRHNLEALLSDLTVSLRGVVTFKPDGNYELGDFMGAVKARHARLLKKAKDSASSFGQPEIFAKIEAMDESRKNATVNQQREQGVLNPAVHYTDWANYSRRDFESVAMAWKELLSTFRCSRDGCEGFVQVQTIGISDAALRCPCGDTNLNLLKK